MRLANKAAQHIIIFAFKDLHGYNAMKTGIVRLVNVGHPSLTYDPAQLIAVERPALQFSHKTSLLVPIFSSENSRVLVSYKTFHTQSFNALSFAFSIVSMLARFRTASLLFSPPKMSTFLRRKIPALTTVLRAYYIMKDSLHSTGPPWIPRTLR